MPNHSSKNLKGIALALFLEDSSQKVKKKNPEIKLPSYFKNQDALTGHDLSSFTKFRIYYETKLPVLILNQQSGTAVQCDLRNL